MKISPNNSHTHCQASQANATTQAWQRVCLSNCTTKTTNNQTDEKEHRTHNITYTQAGVLCFVVQISGKFKVQFFVRSSVVKFPACVQLKTVIQKSFLPTLYFTTICLILSNYNLLNLLRINSYKVMHNFLNEDNLLFQLL